MSFILFVWMSTQGSGPGSARRPREAGSDAAHAALVHPGPEEGARGGSSLDPSPHGSTGDRHTGQELLIYDRIKHVYQLQIYILAIFIY